MYQPKPTKCEFCRTPIMRLLDGQWVCLNCPLYDAIQNRDDVERQRLMTLIDTTRPEKVRAR